MSSYSISRLRKEIESFVLLVRMELARKCPFLARVPSNFIRHARPPVLMSFAETCPVMSQLLDSKTPVAPLNTSGKIGRSHDVMPYR